MPPRKKQPKPVHQPIPLWHDAFTGRQFCGLHSVHGEWVLWPCEDAE